jgi:hypothetical protein
MQLSISMLCITSDSVSTGFISFHLFTDCLYMMSACKKSNNSSWIDFSCINNCFLVVTWNGRDYTPLGAELLNGHFMCFEFLFAERIGDASYLHLLASKFFKRMESLYSIGQQLQYLAGLQFSNLSVGTPSNNSKK